LRRDQGGVQEEVKASEITPEELFKQVQDPLEHAMNLLKEEDMMAFMFNNYAALAHIP
jgi:hypothetical protein